MDQSVFRFIWRYSKRDQLAILAIVLLSLPFYFLALDLPKVIVNKAIQGQGFEEGGTEAAFAIEGWGASLFGGFELDRLSFLVWMSLAFLALVMVNGLFKLVINTAKGRLGERMLRRLRYMLFDRILRFPVGHFRKVKAPELATMIKDEVEPLGGFIGDAYVQPVFLGGQALTALIFIVVQNVWLGLMAGGIALVQALLVPRLRRPILVLGRERQLTARDLAGRIGEVVDGIGEIHVNSTGRYERADMSSRLGRIFDIRFRLYQKKFSVKFINNLLSQVTPFLFYIIGGYLAIKGRLDVGQLVAVIVAYKDLPGPIKELIDWDQRRLDTQIKYDQVIAQFAPDELIDPALLTEGEGALDAPLVVSGLTVADDAERPVLDGVSLTLPMTGSTALTGAGASPLLESIARLRATSGGGLRFGERSLGDLPYTLTGREIGYVGPEVYLRGGTVFDALSYTLRRRPVPVAKPDRQRAAMRAEALRTGNPDDDIDADWIDYAAAGVEDGAGLRAEMLSALTAVEMRDDLYRWGLRERVPMEAEGIGARLLRAREAVAARLAGENLSTLVERFEPDAYVGNGTVAENLLFGAGTGPDFTSEALPRNPALRTVLRDTGLEEKLVSAGREIGKTMVEIFADVAPDNPLIARYSFIAADALPGIAAILKRDRLSEADRDTLLGLAFVYVDVRHRLGVLNEALKAGIVAARHRFRETLPPDQRAAIGFYDPAAPTRGARMIDDILFGRIAHGIAQARERVEAVARDALETEGLLPMVLEAGLSYDVGGGGRQLSASQRQRLGLARALLRRPRLLLIDRALAATDAAMEETVLTRILDRRGDKPTLAALPRERFAALFDRHVAFEGARLAQPGGGAI